MSDTDLHSAPCSQYTYQLQFPVLATLGQYVLDYYWRASEGDFTISMYDVTARGRGLLDVCGNGTVRVSQGVVRSQGGQSTSHRPCGHTAGRVSQGLEGHRLVICHLGLKRKIQVLESKRGTGH